MIKNLIIIDGKSTISGILEKYSLLLGKFPIIKNFFFKNLKRKDLNKLNSLSRKSLSKDGIKILNINKLPLLKYKVPLRNYREQYINYLKKGRNILDFLEKRTGNYNKNYGNLDMHMVYENNVLILAIWDLLDLHFSIKILLDKFEISNIYIPERLELITKLFQLNCRERTVNIHSIRRSRFEKYKVKLVLKIKLLLPLLIPFFNYFNKLMNINNAENNHFNRKYVFNKNDPIIGFLYYSITHKRVGDNLFNFLKERGKNVLEINPTPPIPRYKYRTNKRYNTKSKKILFQIKELYKEGIEKFNNPLFSIYLNEVFKRIQQRIEFDMFSIDYVYKKIKENNIENLVIFNDNSFFGKISALICKKLKIPTIYLPHGAITETHILVFPKWCDIMILNSDIEKRFLLNEKLNEQIYGERLIPLGNSYFKPQNLKKIHYIHDAYDSKFNQALKPYKFKILLGLGLEFNDKKKPPFRNLEIIRQIINVLKEQTDINDYLLIIKLHPTDDIKRYNNFFKYKRDIPIVVSKNIDIRALITSADLYLSNPSTTILESILLKTPTILLDYYYFSGNDLFSDEKFIITVRNEFELKKQIRTLLSDDRFREKYINSTYKHGLKFCIGYEREDFRNTFHEKILQIMQNLMSNKDKIAIDIHDKI